MTKKRVEIEPAQSTAIGLGCLYNTPLPNLSVGCSFQNWGRQTQAFIKEKEPLPFTFKLGVAYKAFAARLPSVGQASDLDSDEDIIDAGYSTLDNRVSNIAPSALVVAMDLNFPADSSAGARMGAEYRFGNGIAIRGGYRTGTGFDFPSGLCAGAGYSTSAYQVDYAFVPYGDIGSTHRISFTITF
jgi:hypothetical protein